MNRTLAALMLAVVSGAGAAWTCLSACSSTPSSPGTRDAEAEAEPLDDAGSPDAIGDTTDMPCNPVKQDCVDPSLRCQIIYVRGEYLTGCEPPWDSANKGEGEVCNRT